MCVDANKKRSSHVKQILQKCNRVLPRLIQSLVTARLMFAVAVASNSATSGCLKTPYLSIRDVAEAISSQE